VQQHVTRANAVSQKEGQDMNPVATFALVTMLTGLPFGTAWAQQPQEAQPQPQQAQPQPQQTPQPQPQQTPSPQAGQPAFTIAADSLVGTKVRDAQGKEIGEISRLMIDAKQGKVAAAIIKQGGALGMGGKEISVPWESLTLQRGQNQQLVVTLQQPLLEQAPSASPGTGGQPERKQQ
jgi:sporulation protein YlmC with PRC-barrel domain